MLNIRMNHRGSLLGFFFCLSVTLSPLFDQKSKEIVLVLRFFAYFCKKYSSQ